MFFLQYLDKKLKKVFVVDPQGIDEEEESKLAAERFRYCIIIFLFFMNTQYIIKYCYCQLW